jgi:hypothetical protein
MTTVDLPALLDELHGYLRRLVATGFDTTEEMLAQAVDLFSDTAKPTLVRLHAQRILRELLAAHQAEQATWPAITDCDRLDAAFAALEAKGIVCRQHFSCCGTCGAYEIWDEAATLEAAGVRVRGYAFYHSQDTEAAVDGDGLYLSYGTDSDSAAAALAIANEIVSALQQHGLQVSWNGSWSQRIGVQLTWQRRRKSDTP